MHANSFAGKMVVHLAAAGVCICGCAWMRATPDTAVRTQLAAAALRRDNAPAVLFTEDRSTPIEPAKGIPQAWLEQLARPEAAFEGAAQPGEFYVFQIGMAAPGKIGPINVHFNELVNTTRPMSAAIARNALRCLSLGGIGGDGAPFQKSITVAPDGLQILWVGIDVPADANGVYKGVLTVDFGDGKSAPVAIRLNVSGNPVPEHGDRNSKNLSRLRWLDSTAGSEDKITAPFIPMVLENRRTLHVLGRKLALGDDGLPAQITSYFSPSNTAITDDGHPVLASPVRFVVENASSAIVWKSMPGKINVTDTRATWTSTLEGGESGLVADVEGRLDYTGSGQVHIRLKAAKDAALSDVRLDIPFVEKASRYFMGLDRKGGVRGTSLDWKWDTSKRQDCFWMGDVNAGLMLRFKDAHYVRPLVNIYYPFRPLVEPASWGNDGCGGIRIGASPANDGVVLARAYSGGRKIKAGEMMDFVFEFYMTPFRPLDTERQWRTRFIHPHANKSPEPFEKALAQADAAHGPNVINLHQATPFSPYINYPYSDDSFGAFCDYVKRAHEKGVAARVYYTTREITNNMHEFVPLHTFNGEIIQPGPGRDARTVVNKNGPNPVLTATLVENFIPAWVDRIGGKFSALDLSVITTPDSRWNNFYLEGLRWLADKSDFDGVYIDDTALDARSLQRARRILDVRPGRLIDLHTWNHFKPLGAFANNLTIYMELLPYIDRLWIGEGFNCNTADWDYWLVEMSGLPFGLMSEMLQSPNPWRGLVFGETARLGWSGDPRPIWKIWDEFGIQETRFLPFYDPACPVKPVGADGIKITVLQKPGRAFIAIGSWETDSINLTLAIDWEALGLDPARARLYAPPIAGMQSEASFAPGEKIPVEPLRGWFLVLDEIPRSVAPVTSEEGAGSGLFAPVFEDPFTQPALESGWNVRASADASVQVSANALRINAPAQHHAGIERALPAGAIAAEVEFECGTDRAQDWGPGFALIWNDGAAVRINFRMQDMSVAVFAAGELQTVPFMLNRDEIQALRMRLLPGKIAIEQKTGDKAWKPVMMLSRAKTLSGDPAWLRVGKTDKTGAWNDNANAGASGECAVRAVRVFGK